MYRYDCFGFWGDGGFEDFGGEVEGVWIDIYYYGSKM